MVKTPVLKNVEQVSAGWVNKYVVTYEMPDGRMHSYECASRKPPEAFQAALEARSRSSVEGGDFSEPPDAVCIVAQTPRDSLVMIREFRYPLNSWCIAFPAGLIDAGEDVVECACRELEEETGYQVNLDAGVRVLPQPGFSSTGLTDETVQIVFVQADRAGESHTEPNELIELFELPIAEIDEFLNTNTIPIGIRAQLVLELYRMLPGSFRYLTGS